MRHLLDPPRRIQRKAQRPWFPSHLRFRIAEADHENAWLTREGAEIAVDEYVGAVVKQGMSTTDESGNWTDRMVRSIKVPRQIDADDRKVKERLSEVVTVSR